MTKYILWLKHVKGGGWKATREIKLCKNQHNADRWANKIVEEYKLSAMLYIAVPEGESPNELHIKM